MEATGRKLNVKSTERDSSFPTHPREYPIFRPREDECPHRLLELPKDESVNLDAIRVAKHQDHVVAAYKFRRLTSLTFEIERVGVSERYRSRGLGSWMLAHAIGIIESKGGREVIVHAHACEFLLRLGFEETDSNQLRLLLTAE